MTTPNAMPQKKNSQIELGLLDGLTATTEESWTRKTLDPTSSDQNKPLVIRAKVTSKVPRHGLAANVSDETIDRLAARWLG